MKNLIGKKWMELDEATREALLSNANCIDGVTGNNMSKSGACIIDFNDYISIEGNVNFTDDDIEIVIDDNAVLYSCK